MQASPVSQQHPRTRRYLVSLLLVSCLVLRALIPAGYMPGNLLTGEFMILCPQAMPVAIMSDGHLHPVEHHAPGQDYVDADTACPIGSALLAAAPPPSLPQIAVLVTATTGREPAATAASPASAYRRYQSRAPPQSVT